MCPPGKESWESGWGLKDAYAEGWKEAGVERLSWSSMSVEFPVYSRGSVKDSPSPGNSLPVLWGSCPHHLEAECQTLGY